MKIGTIFFLRWKSFVRHPLFEQTVVFRSLIAIYIFSLLCLICFLGSFLDYFSNALFPNETNSLKIFVFWIVPLLFLDFILKFIFKKRLFQFISILRFPNSKKSVLVYSVAKEFLNLWNVYLLFFFFSYLTSNISTDYGIFVTIVSFVIIIASQIMISLLVNTLKQNQIDTLYKPLSHFSLGISSKSCIGNYLSLTIKMFIRSPRLRQQMLSYLLITIAYYYLISKQEINFSQMGLLYTSIIFILFPLIFNQFLFSAEAAFFDHMMITPNFRTILLARYILYLVFSVISFVILLFLFPFSWELIAILLYCAGCITLLSFSSILFISKKIDLFGSQYKMMTQTSSAQSFTVLLVYALLISLVILISFVFSPQIAVWFMFITGVVSILFSNAWLKYLYRCFYPNKYEKMEIFRIQ